MISKYIQFFKAYKIKHDLNLKWIRLYLLILYKRSLTFCEVTMMTCQYAIEADFGTFKNEKNASKRLDL